MARLHDWALGHARIARWLHLDGETLLDDVMGILELAWNREVLAAWLVSEYAPVWPAEGGHPYNWCFGHALAQCDNMGRYMADPGAAYVAPRDGELAHWKFTRIVRRGRPFSYSGYGGCANPLPEDCLEYLMEKQVGRMLYRYNYYVPTGYAWVLAAKQNLAMHAWRV